MLLGTQASSTTSTVRSDDHRRRRPGRAHETAPLAPISLGEPWLRLRRGLEVFVRHGSEEAGLPRRSAFTRWGTRERHLSCLGLVCLQGAVRTAGATIFCCLSPPMTLLRKLWLNFKGLVDLYGHSCVDSRCVCIAHVTVRSDGDACPWDRGNLVWLFRKAAFVFVSALLLCCSCPFSCGLSTLARATLSYACHVLLTVF